jgi:hypothetical protein
LSPEKYEVTVEAASAPFVLAFGEAYDPFWRVGLTHGGQVDPTRLYSTINGFPLEGGELRLTVEYLPQDWFALGLMVAIAALIGSLLFMGCSMLRRLGRPARRPAVTPPAGRISYWLWWAVLAVAFLVVTIVWGLLPALLVASFPAAVLVSVPPRLPLAASLAVLLLCPLAIVFNQTSTAELLAVISYYLLSLGILLMSARHLSTSNPASR